MLKTFSGDTSGQTGLAGLEKRLTGNVPDDSVIPAPVRRAVRLMLSGAALTFVVGVFLIIATIINKDALTNSAGKKLSSGEFTSGVISTAVTYLFLVVVWVLMARLNRSGYGWARILASIFCLISTIDAYSLVNSLTKGEIITVVGVVYIVASLALWAIGVTTIAMLWRAESSVYFKSRAAARQ
jgi:hypothetical protein